MKTFFNAIFHPAKTNRQRDFKRRSSDRPLTKAEVRQRYQRPVSFTSKLPWMEYLPQHKVFLLDDMRSVGIVLDVLPIPTEGRSQAFLEEARNVIVQAFADCFPEYDENPWVVQMFAYDSTDLSIYADKVRHYVRDYARDTVFTREYLDGMARHLRGISKPGGLFYDDVVTDADWKGAIRVTRIVIYRRRAENFVHPAGLNAIEEVNEVAEKFLNSLKPAGLKINRLDGAGFYYWMLEWFNPRPPLTDGNYEMFRRIADYPGDGANRPFGADFAESLFYCMPRSDVENQAWFFDGLPHKCITIQRLRRVPQIGQSSGELAIGDKILTMFDRVPEGCMMAMSVVIKPQDTLENEIRQIKNSSIGDNQQAVQTEADASECLELLMQGNKLYPLSLCFYTRAEDLKSLKRVNNQLAAILSNNQMQPLLEVDDEVSIDNYLNNLPMAYRPELDKEISLKRSRLTFMQHIANLSPLFGRSIGTGNPGITFFNRGASPLSFDPFTLKDRNKNAHALILGPTGSGKSATLVYLIRQMMAIIRPRVYVVEKGGSFNLMADYFESKSVSINKVEINPRKGRIPSLPPFAEAHKVIEAKDLTKEFATWDFALSEAEYQSVLDVVLTANFNFKKSDDDDKDVLGDESVRFIDELLDEQDASEETDGDGYERDLMGEMEIVAALMITGGDPKEEAKLSKADRKLIRRAIKRAAIRCIHEKRQTITEDVVAELEKFSKDRSLRDSRRERAQDMADAMDLYCDDFDGQVFNREGELWPEVDCTIIDLGLYGNEGKQGQLTVAYTSIMNTINNVVEKYQYDERPTVVITDEGHIITTNPLLAPFVVKIVKMWRKLGGWYWVATQNLSDFPDSAEKMLSMMEWWILLGVSKDEAEQVSRFKDISEEQKQLMMSTRKAPHKYTEGVVLSDRLETLFRNVPPSEDLALAMTEKDEKVERKKLMDQFQCSEVEAALKVAEKLDQLRGLTL